MRRQLSARRLLVLLLAVAPGALAAVQCDVMPPRALELLKGMARSATTIDFSGVLTLQRGSDMQIVELSHGVADGHERTVLARLTGQDATVRRAAHPVNCLHPGHRLRLALPSDTEGGMCGLASHYRFDIQPGERIAGRDTLRLVARPRDMYRFGHVFDLDRESSLVLRATTLAADRRVLEQYQFASLELHTSGSASASTLEHLAQHPHPNEPPATPEGLPWRPAWLPEGFAATDAAPAPSRRKSYTDGMASFSVFLESLPGALPPGEGLERQGSTLAYSRGVRLQGEPVLLTVIGEVPVNTARMVADSVRLLSP